MKTKIGFLVLLTVFFSLFIAGCDKKAAETAKEDTSAAQAEEKELPPPTKEEVGYALGVVMAASLKDIELELDYDSVVKGIKETVKKDTVDTAASRAILERASEHAYKTLLAKNLAEEKAFLEKNAQKEGVKTTPSGLQYEVISEGTGAVPAETDTVKVHYKGMLLDGKVFDSSYDRNEPAVLPLKGVIAGWTEGLQLMKTGSKYTFYIPSSIGYGEHGAGDAIPPNSLLIFEVELLEIVPSAGKKLKPV